MDQFEEVDPDSLPSPTPDEEEEDTLTSAFVDKLTDRILQFQEVLVGHKLHEYQLPFARRMIRSVIVRDGEEITALASRQSGKTETVSSIMATMMILMPRLAVLYPKLLGTYKNGLWVGFFAPTEGQADTLFGRTVNYLTSERALEIMGDPEIDDAPGRPGGAVRSIALKKSGSTLMMMTANPRAKIESKSFHVIVVDECQEVDDFMLSKSIAPMLAYYKGTMIKTGTPTTSKNNFYRSIQLNKRRATESRRVPPCHFEWDWKEVQKANSDYGDYIRKEMLRIGEDSDEFQMSYCPTPETRILTADLRHIPAGEVKVGDRLVGFEEERSGKGLHRRLQETVVEDVGRLVLPCYKITLSDGTEVTCSSDHQWLITTAGRRTEWKRTEDLVATDRIFKVTDVWEHVEDYRTGYLAAAFDGEGHFSRQSMLGFSQRGNAMQEKVRKYLDELGFRTWERVGTGTNKDVDVLHIAGGRAEIMRFLGQVRPERLLDKFDLNSLGTLGRHSRMDDKFSHPRVVSVEFVGDREVVAIKTSTKTYVAEGLASHNCCRWLLDRGMFVTQTVMDELGDLSMETVRNYHQTPVIVGIDPARKMDSTVVTVVWVDWDRPDEFGYYDHRVLNWMEIQGEDWEEQYFQIVQFLQNYNVLAVGVDTNGVGDAIASRLKRLMPRAEIVECSSSTSEQTKRWTHLQALIQRKMIGWPAHAKTRRLRVWKRFYQQMLDAEKKYKGASFLVEAPNEAHAHDDYVDSLAIACSLTQDLVMPHVEVSHNVFMGSRSR